MSEFHECVVGTFDKELQALIDYGHDCCARIDDRIHECCQRIREAHEREIGAFELALRWKDVAPLPQYDALGNERHKVVCKLREMPDCYPSYSAFPFIKWYEDLSTALGIDKGEISCAKVRDTLIHLLGGDAMEVEDGVDAGRCGDTSVGGDVHAAAGRVDNCAGDQLAEGVTPITTELREWASVEVPYKYGHQLNAIADRIDAEYERAMAAAAFIAGVPITDENMAEHGLMRLPVDGEAPCKQLGEWIEKRGLITGPLDHDGELWHKGDMSASPWGVIEGIVYENGKWFIRGHDTSAPWLLADSLLHYHAPTVEDVLRGVVTLCHNTWKEGSAFEFYDVDDVMKSGNIADFAAKLRLAEDANA